MEHEVFIHKQAKRKFEKLKNKALKLRLSRAFSKLKNPFLLDTIKVAGEETTYRTRVGGYRIIWELGNMEIFISDFDTREKIYKQR